MKVKRKVFRFVILAILLVALPLTVFLAQQQQDIRQRASTANCGDSRNLLQNCDFEQTIDFNNRRGPDWRDSAIDETRNAGAGQYTRQVSQTSVSIRGKVLQVGQEVDTCSLPRTAGGGGSDLFRLFPEAGQYINVGTASRFHIAFDIHMKSRHTRQLSAPVYVWTALRYGEIEKGRESFLAYTPHDTSGEFCNDSPFTNDFKCKIGVDASETDCSDAVNGWKHIEYDFNRTTICEHDQGCINNARLLHIGFGVTNDYDTITQIDNVIVTSPELTGPIVEPTFTPTPTTPPTGGGGRVKMYFADVGNDQQLNSLQLRPGQRKQLRFYLDTQGNGVTGFETRIRVNGVQLDTTRGLGADEEKFSFPVKDERESTYLFYAKMISITDFLSNNLARGKLHLATITLIPQAAGSCSITFNPNSIAPSLTTLVVDRGDITNCTVSSESEGGGGGRPTATPATGGAGQPPTSRRTFFVPLSIPCVTPTEKGMRFGCLLFAPRP